MAVGVRTQDLRKIYSSAPPMAAGGFVARGAAKGSKQPKPQITALDGLSLEIQPGEIFGLLGPNGAGKSTTVGVLTTRVRPTSGRAWIGEHDVWQAQAEVKHLIGVVPQRPNHDFSLTAREILIFHAAYFGMGANQRNERADSLLEKFKLTDRANQMVRGFSGGMMQRLSIARAMMHDPQVLFLDEPSAGLDPQARRAIHDLILDLRREQSTILLTTHYIEEAEKLCDRVAIIDEGRIIAIGTPREIQEKTLAVSRIEIRCAPQLPDGETPDWRESEKVTVEPCRSRLSAIARRPAPAILEMVDWLRARGLELTDIDIQRPTLEEAFIELTGKSLRE